MCASNIVVVVLVQSTLVNHPFRLRTVVSLILLFIEEFPPATRGRLSTPSRYPVCYSHTVDPLGDRSAPNAQTKHSMLRVDSQCVAWQPA